MDSISSTWFSEMEMELDGFGFTPDQDHQGMIEESLKNGLSSESYTSYNSSSSSQILCFDNSLKPQDNISDETNRQSCTMIDLKFSSHDDHQAVNVKREVGCDHQFARPTAMKESKNINNNNNNNKRTFSTIGRSIFHAQDHVMAERKRREKLGQRFIALSAIVPGLKKTDKASVLGGAIKYLKELQERVNTLDEKCKKRTIESVVLVRKSQLQLASNDHDTSLSNKAFDIVDNNDPSGEFHMIPEIEARVLNGDVLVRIHCEKRKGDVVEKILSEIEKLHLCAVLSNAVPFGSSILDITIVAQMESQFSLSMRDLVKTLRLALLNII